MMGRTGRLRNEIAQYLEDNGESNTSQILEHINKRFRWGAHNEPGRKPPRP